MQDIDCTTDFVKAGMFMSGIDLKRVLEKEEKRSHKNFFMVSNRIFELGLKPRDFIVYCCLLRHSDNNIRTCFPSRRLIAKECCMDRKTVDSAVENLSALGLVKRLADIVKMEQGQAISTMLPTSWNSVNILSG